jgi:oligopeptide transport system substrate-binding protein
LKSQSAIVLIIICIVVLAAGCMCDTESFTENGGYGTLNLYGSNPTTLDPAISTETTSAGYIMQLYSGLLKLDDNLDPVPDIAEAIPQISNDGLTYTFKLRDDVFFHNGNNVTAYDFKYSWERAVNPATNSQTAATYLGDIAGVNDVLAGKSNYIEGLEVVDDYTLKVTINSPKSYFLYKLTYPTTFVIDNNVAESNPLWWNNPVGTGPFKLAQWVENQSLTLERNSRYYGDKANLSEIDYQFLSGRSIDLYETGSIDVCSVSTSYKDKVFDSAGPFYDDLSISNSLGTTYIGYNCNKPPFDDPAIRKAFALAIDKDKIVSLIYRDMVEIADGLLPPGIPGYNENLQRNKFNAAEARELIESSVYKDISNLPEITLTTYGYGGSVGSLIEAMVYQWKEYLGIDVKVRQIETEYYFYHTQEEIDNMFLMGWSADYPHPQNFLDILFSSDSGYNYGQYSNNEYDSMINDGNSNLDEGESYQYYHAAEQILIDDAALIPISHDMNYLLIKPYVSGYKMNAIGFVPLNHVSIK